MHFFVCQAILSNACPVFITMDDVNLILFRAWESDKNVWVFTRLLFLSIYLTRPDIVLTV